MTLPRIIFVLFFILLLNGQIPLKCRAAEVTDPHLPTEQEAINLENAAKETYLQWNRKAIEKAISDYAAASENWKALNRPQRAAYCLRQIGELELVLSDVGAAEQHFLQGLAIARSAKDDEEQANILSHLSLVATSKSKKNKNKSMVYLTEALFLAERSGSPAAGALANFSAGQFYYFSDQDTAETYYKRSVELWRAAGDLRGEASSLLKLGHNYIDKNEYIAAAETLNDSLIKWKQSGDTRGLALTLRALGNLSNASNNKQEALEYYKSAGNLIPKDLDFTEQGALSNGFGSICEAYGEFETSIFYRKKALELFDKDENEKGRLATFSSLARLHSLAKRDLEANTYFDEAERSATALKDYLYLAIINEDRGDFYFNRDMLSEAKEHYLTSYQFLQVLQKNNKSSNFRQVSSVFNKLGQIAVKRNSLKEAREFFLDSLELNKKVADKLSESNTLYQIANLDYLENKMDDALKMAAASISATESIYSDVLNFKLRRQYLANVFERYELYIDLLMKKHQQYPDKGFASMALQANEKARARSILETLLQSEGNFTKDADPELLKRERDVKSQLSAKSDELTDLYSEKSDQARIDKCEMEINDLNIQRDEITAQLKRASPIYSSIKDPPAFNVEEFQRDVLDDNSILLEFSLGKNESYLWVIDKEKVTSYILPPRQQIEGKVQKLRELLTSYEMTEAESVRDYQARLAAIETDYWRDAQVLSNEILGPAAAQLGNKCLIIVADGKLHYFPISALPFPGSNKNEPLLLANEVVYEPSALVLSRISADKSHSEASPKDLLPKNLLMFSDPVFSWEDSRVPGKPVAEENVVADLSSISRFAESMDSLPRLKASQMESDAIRDIVGASLSDIFSGFSASRDQLMQANISDYKIIHFATHGIVNETRPELSGIVLSGFNDEGKKLEKMVRIGDVYGMNIKADLVVLSACNTGIGKELKGEGLMSLNNAFLGAGAQTVVSSLWKVKDSATMELMQKFYYSLSNENIAPSKALRKAQIQMWQSGRHTFPFYWAAFTVQGKHNNPILLVHDRNNFLRLFFVIGLLAIVGYGLYRWRQSFSLNIGRAIQQKKSR